jgi:hypothetical protein
LSALVPGHLQGFEVVKVAFASDIVTFFFSLARLLNVDAAFWDLETPTGLPQAITFDGSRAELGHETFI